MNNISIALEKNVRINLRANTDRTNIDQIEALYRQLSEMGYVGNPKFNFSAALVVGKENITPTENVISVDGKIPHVRCATGHNNLIQILSSVSYYSFCHLGFLMKSSNVIRLQKPADERWLFFQQRIVLICNACMRTASFQFIDSLAFRIFCFFFHSPNRSPGSVIIIHQQRFNCFFGSLNMRYTNSI